MAMQVARRNEGLPDRTDWQTMREMAEAFHQSGLLPSWIKNPLAALAVIQKGAELGMTPMYSLSRISMIEGKPCCDAEGMAALVYRDHGANAIRFIETSADCCTIEYCRRGGTPGQLSFTLEDAKTANLLGKQNWKNYPQAMLRARCISAMARMAFPDSIGGLYTHEELGAEVEINEHGEVTLISESPSLPAPAESTPTPIAEAPSKKERARANTPEIVPEPTPAENERAEALTGKKESPRDRWARLVKEAEAAKYDRLADVKAFKLEGLTDAEITTYANGLEDRLNPDRAFR